jgi:hypothetical protein
MTIHMQGGTKYLKYKQKQNKKNKWSLLRKNIVPLMFKGDTPPSWKTLPKQNLQFLLLKGFTYSKISKDSTIPLEHIKSSCLQPTPIYNTLTWGVTIILILPLLILLQWTRPSSMQYLHFIISSLFSIVGGVLSGNQVGRCSHVGGVW